MPIVQNQRRTKGPQLPRAREGGRGNLLKQKKKGKGVIKILLMILVGGVKKAH